MILSLIRLLVVCQIALLATGTAVAQEGATPSTNVQQIEAAADGQLTVAEVESRLADLESNTSIESAIKDMLKPKYQSALELLKQTAANELLTRQYKASLTSAPPEVARLEAERDKIPSAEQAVQIARRDFSSLDAEGAQRQVDASDAELALLNGNLATINQEKNRIGNRPAAIIERMPLAEQELAKVRTQLEAPDMAADPASPARTAERTLLQATAQKLQSEIDFLNQEQQSQSIREKLLTSQSQLLQRKIENAQAVLQELGKAKNELLISESQQIVDRANEILLDSASEPASQQMAQEVIELASELDELVLQLKPVATAREHIETRLKRLDDETAFIEAQLGLGGDGEVISQLLFDLRSRILRRGDNSDMTRKLPALDAARLASLEISRKDVEQRRFERELSESTPPAISQLISMRGTLLTRLHREHQMLINGLSLIEQKKQTYSQKAKEGLHNIGEQLFWIKSYPEVSVSTFSQIPRGLQAMLSRENWNGLGNSFGKAARQTPVRLYGFVILIVLLLICRPRLITSIEKTTKATRRISTDRYLISARALVWTVLLAAPVSLVCLLAYWVLSRDNEASRWLQAVTYAAGHAAIMVFVLALVIEMCRPRGLGIGHFGWHTNTARRMRAKTLQFALLYVPSMMMCVASVHANVFSDSLGRVGFFITQIAALVFIWQLFGSPKSLLANVGENHPERLVAETRRFWYPLLMLTPLLLLVLAWIGYLVTALHLTLELFGSMAITLIGVVGYWMSYRWYTLKARKLALEEAIHRRETRLQTARENKEETSELVTVNPEDEIQLDIDAMGTQTRHVLQTAFMMAVIMCIALLWSETIPLFSALNRIVLPGGFNLLSLTKAALVLILFSVAVRNLPGLLELSILRTKSIDSGTRYAITRICQYVVIAIGAAVLFSILKIDWSKLGWIAAALSVGLGFGLQEVVANFVCGLILLFERPVRVGDVVTIDTTTGTVTRIQMRATTITNWERQELIVPNKNLITGTILNWTLSSSICRIVLPVGVAYGTDTRRARQILLDIAVSHPLVLKEPSPSTTFDHFADSSLIITLRCFIPNLDERLKTISDLHSEIDNRFEAEGIEIAFPQVDVHMRNIADADLRKLSPEREAFS